MCTKDWAFSVQGSRVRFEALERIASARSRLGRPNTVVVSISDLLAIAASRSKKPVYGRDNVVRALRKTPQNRMFATAKRMDARVIKAAKKNLDL